MNEREALDAITACAERFDREGGAWRFLLDARTILALVRPVAGVALTPDDPTA